MTTNTTLKTYFEKGDQPTQDHFYQLIDKLADCVYGTHNPPDLTQLTSLVIKRGDYYVQTNNGLPTGTEVQRSLFNGAQLSDWTVTAAVYTAMSIDQKNAVKILNITA